MRSTLSSIVAACIGAALWLLWAVEHEHTSVRAPWTGMTYVAAACGFVAAGYLGRRWPALVIAALAAVAATVLVDPLVWQSDPAREPTYSGDCDPGCISTGAAAVMAAVAAALLAALGMLLRAAVTRLRRSPSPAGRGDTVAPWLGQE